MMKPSFTRSRSDVLRRPSRNRYFHARGHTEGNIQKTTQNSNSSWDNTSQQRAASIWDAGQQAANNSPSQGAQEAAATYTGLQKGGDLGFRAMTGDQGAAQQMMNPYQSQVIDANNKNWQKINANTVNQTNDAATAAGAFGGSRHGVAEGVALSENNDKQAAQDAGLMQTGFESTMNRAGQAANLGFGAAGQAAQQMSPEERRLALQKQAFLGPQGQQSSGAQTTMGLKQTADYGVGIG